MKVSVVAGICCEADAISESIIGTVRAITDGLGASCRLFSYRCDFAEVDAKIVGSSGEIVLDAHYIASDIIIYHFGIYCELFNSILLGNGHSRQFVYYHNITPKHLVAPNDHITVDKSLRQLANLDVADEIWTASRFSRDSLIEYGLAADRIEIIPLYVKPHFHTPSRQDKLSEPVTILSVGRFVASKGLTDLLRAAAIARDLTDRPFRLELVGHSLFSDVNYVTRLKKLVVELGLERIVEFVVDLSDKELWPRYLRAQILATASYHEGFCVPVIEAMRARCVPVTYDSGNFPDLVGAYGDVIACGDYRALGQALARHIDFFGRPDRDATSVMQLGLGAFTLAEYDRAVEDYVMRFTYSQFCDRVVAKLQG